jgi:cell fate (sporulation/competence/biofilm development) regulator YlbF (YheA/YmcA/DUF963 family)
MHTISYTKQTNIQEERKMKKAWETKLQKALDALHEVHTEMETYQEERSEAWQDSDKGNDFMSRTDDLFTMINDLESVIENDV